MSHDTPAVLSFVFFVFKQKTAYELRISDWSSDVCSSDLGAAPRLSAHRRLHQPGDADLPVARTVLHAGAGGNEDLRPAAAFPRLRLSGDGRRTARTAALPAARAGRRRRGRAVARVGADRPALGGRTRSRGRLTHPPTSNQPKH